MFPQSVVIAVIILVISTGFFISKKKKWALIALPLGFLPFSNVVLGFVYNYVLKKEFDGMAAIIVLSIATVISCSALGALTMLLIKRKETRSLYITVGVVFNVILEIILLKYYLI